MEEKVKKLLESKISERKNLDKDFSNILYRLCPEYTYARDKIDTEIEILEKLLKE